MPRPAKTAPDQPASTPARKKADRPKTYRTRRTHDIIAPRYPHAAHYDPERAAKVCELVASGMTLKQIGKIKGMPFKRDIQSWRDNVPEFAAAFTRAKIQQMDHFSEEIVEIADDGSNDWMDRETASGRIVRTADYEHIKRSELRVNTRKFLMAKIAPRIYGDKMALTDADGGSLLDRFRAMTDAERDEMLLKLAIKAGLVIEHRPAAAVADEGESGEEGC